jgi:hypothetical protein
LWIIRVELSGIKKAINFNELLNFYWLRGPDLACAPFGCSVASQAPRTVAIARACAIAYCSDMPPTTSKNKRPRPLGETFSLWLRGPDLNWRPSGYEFQNQLMQRIGLNVRQMIYHVFTIRYELRGSHIDGHGMS